MDDDFKEAMLLLSLANNYGVRLEQGPWWSKRVDVLLDKYLAEAEHEDETPPSDAGS
jgi:hypothetical protein